MKMVGLENQINEIGFIKKVAKTRGWRIEQQDSLNFTIWINDFDYIQRTEVPVPGSSFVSWLIHKYGFYKTCGFNQILEELNGLMK